MDVDRHPREVVDRVHHGYQRPGVGDPLRRHHEGQPGIGDEHDRRADDVETESEPEMHQRVELPPAVVVGVEEERLGEEQQHVGQKRRREHAHQVVGELRVQRDEHERQERAEGRREREGDREQLREFVGEPVVSRITGLVADRLDDEREDRHGQDEGREQEVELRDRPDRDAAADDREPSGTRPPRRALPEPWLSASAFSAASPSSRGVGSAVDGRSPVRLLVLAVEQHRDDHHDAAEHQQSGDRTEHEQQLAVHQTVHCCPPLSAGLAAASAVAGLPTVASAEAGARAARSRCSARTWATIAHRSAGGIGHR